MKELGGSKMKKLVEINVVCNGSTGKIMCDIAKEANNNNIETYCFYGRGNPNKNVNCIKIGNTFSVYFHALIARLGFNGRGSYFSTKKLVKQIKKINPDIIHLHNIHGYYINLKVLFKYLKNEYNGKIIWTLHDCWAFTGHCSYFTLAKCNKWKKHCCNCPQLKSYPKTIFDTTKKEYNFKKKLFLGLNNVTLVTPSVWLKKLVQESFLKNYNVEVINNGIDLNLFKPIYDKQIYKKYNIPKNKKILLGVANIWEERKGLKDIYKLADMISSEYQIVIVGNLLKNEKKSNIIYIDRTDNSEELVKLYTIAYYVLNFTYEDNYPTINLESIACHTPVITYNTGGCAEQLTKDSGVIFEPSKIKDVSLFLNEKRKFNFENSNVNSSSEMVENYIKIVK